MSDIRHTRRIPEAWPDLMAFAEKTIPPGTQELGRIQALRLLQRIHTLGHQALEANNYFSLGEVMTGMHMRLRDPHTRRHVVQEAAQLMVTRAARLRGSFIPMNEPFIPLVNDLSPANLEQPFRQIAKEEMAFMSPAQQGLARSLSVATAFGRWAPKPFRYVRPLMLGAMTRQIRGAEDHPVENIARNTLTGALTVWRRLLLARDPGQAFHSHSLVAIRAEDVAMLQQSRTFVASASLRIDEFKGEAGWKGSGSSEWFDPRVLATPPPPLPIGHKDLEGALRMHTDRLVCPAVHAGGLAGVVAREIVPEIIGAARLLIPSEVVSPKEIQ